MKKKEDIKKIMDARTMLADMDIRTDKYGHRRMFSVKLITTKGKLYFLPQAYACGVANMDMKKYRYRGVQPCDCKANPEGHLIPVKITNIIEYNGYKIDWANGNTI
jgi:hypothetical protein